MVNKFGILTVVLLLFTANTVCAENYENISTKVSAKACDNLKENDSIKTVENRAVDKACLSAVKLSGILQKYAANLSDHAHDLISYRIIDEFMPIKNHEVSLNDGQRVCVEVESSIEMTNEDMNALIQEYKNSAPIGISQAQEISEKVMSSTSFKPQTIEEKKLIYISPMSFWDGTETNHYTEYFAEQFADNDHFFVTENKEIADFIITPKVVNAEVDEVDADNHKMKMIIELHTDATHDESFEPLNELQSHFILFSASRNEQEIADTMIRKLFARASQNTINNVSKYIEKTLEKEKLGK